MKNETPGQKTPSATLLDLATGTILLSGIVLALVGWLLAGVQFSVAVGAGAIVAFAHWWLTRRAGERFIGGIADGEALGQGAGKLLFVFVFKLGLLALVCLALFKGVGLSPIGFAMGWGALLIGALLTMGLGWLFPTSRGNTSRARGMTP